MGFFFLFYLRNKNVSFLTSNAQHNMLHLRNHSPFKLTKSLKKEKKRKKLTNVSDTFFQNRVKRSKPLPCSSSPFWLRRWDVPTWVKRCRHVPKIACPFAWNREWGFSDLSSSIYVHSMQVRTKAKLHGDLEGFNPPKLLIKKIMYFSRSPIVFIKEKKNPKTLLKSTFYLAPFFFFCAKT
jgi:hypothetical protein